MEHITPFGVVIVILISAIWVALFFGAVQLFYRYVINYYLSASALVVRLFGAIQLCRFSYASITEVRVIRQVEILLDPLLLFGALKLGNRVFGPVVIIKRARCFVNLVIISPDKPYEFAQHLRLKLISQDRPEAGSVAPVGKLA